MSSSNNSDDEEFEDDDFDIDGTILKILNMKMIPLTVNK